MISELCDYPDYLDHLTVLDLSHNNINRICEDFIGNISEGNTITHLNLTYNNLETLPKNIVNLSYVESLEEVTLVGKKKLIQIETQVFIGN